MPGFLNMAGSFFSLYFYTWMHPDMVSIVRIGFNEFKVTQTIYLGSFIWSFMVVCFVCPWFTCRENALIGNIGMAFSSCGVIVNHYLIENGWPWGGLVYIMNIFMYVICMAFGLMGQLSTYHYDKNRMWKIAPPFFANILMISLCYGFLSDTNYNDIMPWVSFGLHTNLAIVAQVSAPRTKPHDFFLLLNRFKQERAFEKVDRSPVVQNSRNHGRRRRGRR